MKRNIFLLLGVLFGLKSFSWAAFENQGWGVRAIGMGEAFTALSDDSSGLFWNPAGTSWMKRAETSFMWQKAYAGLTDLQITSGFVSTVIPTRLGSVGIAITDHNFGSLLRENTVALHYGHKLGNVFSAGINFKYLTHDYKIGKDPAYAASSVFANGTSKGAVTLDAGLMVRPVEQIYLGWSGRNLTEPDVGLASKDRVSAEHQAGVAWRPNQRFTLEMDGLYVKQDLGTFKDNASVLLGLEYWMGSERFMSLGLRAGAGRNLGSAQRKAVEDLSAGASVLFAKESWLSFRLDYAFSVNINLSESYSGINKSAVHKVGLALLFGNPG